MGGGALYGGSSSQSACAPNCYQPQGLGLQASYYTSLDVTLDRTPFDAGTLFLSTLEPALDFSWGSAPPRAGMASNGYSVLWNGFLVPRITGAHRVCFDTEGASSLALDGVSVSCANGVTLVAGRRYALDARLQHLFGLESAILRWQEPGSAGLSTVPTSALRAPDDLLTDSYRCDAFPNGACRATRLPFCDVQHLHDLFVPGAACTADAQCAPSRCDTQRGRCEPSAAVCPQGVGTGLWGSYFSMLTDGGLSPQGARLDPQPASVVVSPTNSTQYLVRWAGFVRAPVDDLYTLCVTDGVAAVLRVNGLLEGADVTPACTRIGLRAGQLVRVEAQALKFTLAPVRLTWQSRRVPHEAIPTAYLFPTPTQTVDAGVQSLRLEADAGAFMLADAGVVPFCAARPSPPASCRNGVRDGDELNTDCGGVCAVCNGCAAGLLATSCPVGPLEACSSTAQCPGRLECSGGQCRDLCPAQVQGDGFAVSHFSSARVFDTRDGAVFIGPPEVTRRESTAEVPVQSAIGGQQLSFTGTQWEAELQPTVSGLHEFTLVPSTVFAEWGVQVGTARGAASQPLAVTLTAGQKVRVRFHYVPRTLFPGPASFQWRLPNAGAPTPIPTSAAFSGLAPCGCFDGGGCPAVCTADSPCTSQEGACVGNAGCAGGAVCSDAGVCRDPCPSGWGSGLHVEYFPGTSAVGAPAAARLTALPSVSGADGPLPPPFVAQLRGGLRVPKTGPYVLCLVGTAAATLELDGRAVATAGGTCATVQLVEGSLHDVRVHSVHEFSSSQVQLTWASTSIPTNVIPTSQLFPADAGAARCRPPTTPGPECSNGLLDSRELNVDCGGDCPPCVDCAVVSAPSSRCPRGLGAPCGSDSHCAGRLVCGADGGCADDCPQQVFGDGVWARYYDESRLVVVDGVETRIEPPVVSRVEPTVDADFTSSVPPGLSAPSRPYLATWDAELLVPTSGDYSFGFDVSAGLGAATLRVAGSAVLPNGTVALVGGTRVALHFEYRHFPRPGEHVRLRWMPPGASTFDTIPRALLVSGRAPCGCLPGSSCVQRCEAARSCHVGEGRCVDDAGCAAGAVCGVANGAAFGLEPSENVCVDPCAAGQGGGLWGEYRDATGALRLARLDPSFLNAPVPGLAPGWTVRWSGSVRPEFSAPWRLCLPTTEVGRVFLDGALIADSQSCSLPMTLVGGRRYELRVELLVTRPFSQLAQVTWQSPETPKGVIARTASFPPPSVSGGCRSVEPPPAAACSNGVQDVGELDVDCGGVCAPCPRCVPGVCSAACPCGVGSPCASSDECVGRLACVPGIDLWRCRDACPQNPGPFFDDAGVVIGGLGSDGFPVKHGDGLWAEYFGPDQQWSMVPTDAGLVETSGRPVLAHVEQTVNVSSGSPVVGLATNSLLFVRWTGEFEAASEGVHEFCLTSTSPGAVTRLSVDGVPTACDTPFTLVPRQRLALTAEVLLGSVPQLNAALTYRPPGASVATVIPQQRLFSLRAPCETQADGGGTVACSATKPCVSGQGVCTPARDALLNFVTCTAGTWCVAGTCVDPCGGRAGVGLTAEYVSAGGFDGADAGRAVRVEAPALAVFAPPIAGFPSAGWSVRWRGALRPSVTGLHSLLVNCNRDCRLRVDGRLVADTAAPRSAPLSFVAGRRVAVEFEVLEVPVSFVTAQLGWSGPSTGFADQLVPVGVLFPLPAVVRDAGVAVGLDAGCAP